MAGKRRHHEDPTPVIDTSRRRRGYAPFTRDRDVFGRERVWALTAAEAAELDRAAGERWSVAEGVLMESAARAAALVLHRLHPEGRVIGAVGSGNNGGDALVLLRVLQAWGRDVAWLRAGSRAPDRSLLHGSSLPEIEDGVDADLSGAAVLVDGILGTGASGAPRGRAAEAIARLNRAGRPVLALDLPSGVDPSTGAIPGDSVDAEATVTFGHPKLGLLLHPARGRCGRIVAVEIGFGPADPAPGARLITPDWVRARLPSRTPDAHKATAGKVLLLAGRAGVGGAAVIAGRGVLRGGAGYTRIASVEANRSILQARLPEAIFVDRSGETELRAAAEDSDVIAAGPGIGTDAAARACLDLLLEASGSTPVLLDADALTLYAGRVDALASLAARRPVVVTPHPGEMARLTEESTGDVVADRLRVARTFAVRTGCVVLLKGQPSIVAVADGPLLLNTAGSSDLATAGMGDHLTGAIAALLGAGLSALDAAGVGLFLSSRAADLARRGPALLPGDVAEAYPVAWERPGSQATDLQLPFILFDQPPRW